MCVFMFLAPECSLSLAVQSHTARCDRSGPANINVTELMFCSLKFPLQYQIMNFTSAPCETHALSKSSSLISRYKYIIKFSNITYTRGTYSEISSNFNMNFRTRNLRKGSQNVKNAPYLCCECLTGRRRLHALLSLTVHYYVLFQLENKCMDLYVYVK